MLTEDEKNYYNLLANNDILQYLNNLDKGELSLTCKYILQLTHRFRLFKFHLTNDFINKIVYKSTQNISLYHDNLSIQIDSLQIAIKNRKYYTKWMEVGPQVNYYVLNHMSNNLNNLTNLYLTMLLIPKQAIQSILGNLPILNSLHLCNIIITLQSDEDSSINFNFPNHLKNLKLNNCRQLYCNITDPVALNDHHYKINFNQLPILNLSLGSIAKLNQLTLQDSEEKNVPILNQLLASITQLIRYNTVFSCLNNHSLSIISKNQNLKTLSFDFFYYGPPNTITNFINLPFIKSLYFAPITSNHAGLLKSIIKSCSNLESLSYYWTSNSNIDELLTVEEFPKLKKLIIINHLANYKSLSLNILNLNLEYIELQKFDPLKVNIRSIIVKLPKLKRIKIIHEDKCFSRDQSTQFYFNLSPGWSAIFYPFSIDSRKN